MSEEGARNEAAERGAAGDSAAPPTARPASRPADHPPADAARRAALRHAADAAARGYFEARRARIDDFVARTFSVRGTLRLHRAAFGWDLARAPANIALAPAMLGAKAAGAAAGKLGAGRSADWLRSRRLVLTTDVGRAVERAVLTDLLELPSEGHPRDALAEAIAQDPEVRALLGAAAPEGSGADSLGAYLDARAAVAEMTAAMATATVGAATFQKLTPGMISLGPSVAGAMANSAAVSAFPLGATAGSAWYAAFPAAASPVFAAATTAGLVAGGAAFGAFAGVIADPVQARLGIHQRRLRRLVDALEAEFLGEDGPGFSAREHYYARLFDVMDAASAAARLVT